MTRGATNDSTLFNSFPTKNKFYNVGHLASLNP